MKRITSTTLLTIIMGFKTIEAQEILSSSGDYFETSTTKISWTIGESINETLSNSSYIITQGFHQAKLTITSINEFPLNEVEISIYPNPTNDKLLIDVKSNEHEVLNYKISDIGGNIIMNKLRIKDKEIIDMESYPPAIYLLTIQSGNSCEKTYRIIKQ